MGRNSIVKSSSLPEIKSQIQSFEGDYEDIENKQASSYYDSEEEGEDESEYESETPTPAETPKDVLKTVSARVKIGAKNSYQNDSLDMTTDFQNNPVKLESLRQSIKEFDGCIPIDSKDKTIVPVDSLQTETDPPEESKAESCTETDPPEESKAESCTETEEAESEHENEQI